MNVKNILFLGSALAMAAASRASTIHFDELPAQEANGLTFGGVTFEFQIGGVDSDDATFGFSGVPTLTYVQGPVLEGNALGLLKLSFASPQNQLSFGLAYDSFEDYTPAAAISFFDGLGNLLGLRTMETHTLIDFSEGQFNYDDVEFVSAEIDFSGSNRFALDNLSFNNVARAVPENLGPVATLALIGLVGMHYFTRRRRSV